MPFRSLRSLATRTLAAGAVSALALTMLNAAQPSLGGSHKVSPGTLKDVQLTLSPVAAGPVDSSAQRRSGSATLPDGGSHAAAGGGATPGTGSGRAAPRVASAPVAVGKARFVGFSWPEQAAVGTVWLRARTAGGWSGWREVEQAADGPDATSREYRPGRAYSDGQWLAAGTAEIQVRVDPPAAKAGSGAGDKAGAQAVPSKGWRRT